jgi:putative transposon-encoded protein
VEESCNEATNTMKVKITSKEKEYEGIVEEKVVTPFGNSAHINVGRKHSGKYLPIIIPANPEYAWVLPERDLTLTIQECKEALKNEDSKLKHYKLEAVKNIQCKRFSLADLELVLKILDENLKNKPQIKKIKTAYNL